MRESEIERKVVKWSREQGMLPLKLTPVSDGGWPDHFWLFYSPFIAFIEFKTPIGVLSIRQKLRIAELKRRGYHVAIIRSVEEGIAFLESASLSIRGGTPRDQPSVRGVLNVPGDGEDNYDLRDLQNPQGKEFR